MFRSGTARARLIEAGSRLLLTYGRAVVTNGRIWLRVIGAASFTNGSTSWLAVFSLRTAGRSELRLGPSTLASVLTLPSVDCVWLRAPGSFATAVEMFWFSFANDWSTALPASTRVVIWWSLSASVAVSWP